MFTKNYHISVTEEIRRIPVKYLLNLEMQALDQLEKRLKKEAHRSALTLKWIKGIKSLRNEMKEYEEERNGK